MPCNHHILTAIYTLLLLNIVIDPCCARRNKQRSNSGSGGGSNSQVHHPILAPAPGSESSPSLPIGDSLDDPSLGKPLSFAAEPSSQYVAFDGKKVSFKCTPRPKTANVTWLFNSKPLNESYFSPYLKAVKYRLNIQLPKINPTANDDSGNSQAGNSFTDPFSHNNNGYFDPSKESSLQKLALMRSIMAKLEGSIQCLITSPINNESLLSNPVKILIATLESFPMAQDNPHSYSSDSSAANVTHVVNYIEDNTAVITCNLPHSVPIAVAEYLFTPTPLYNANTATGSSATGTILIDKSTNVDKYLIMPSGDLQILSIKPNDSGIYECIAHNPLIGDKKKSPNLVHLKVRKRTSQSNRNFAHPKLTSTPKPYASAIVGSNLTLECAASSASPGPTITWYKVNGTLPLQRFKQVAGNLIINSVEKSDEGTYVCSVEPPNTGSNDHRPLSKMEARSLVTILEPVGVSISKNLVTSANRFELAEFNLPSDSPAVIIQCTAKGNPRPNIYWAYNGVTLNDAHDFGIYALNPSSIVSADTSRILVRKDKVPMGLVQCFATNELGTVYDSVRIWEPTDVPFPDDLFEPSSFNTFKDEEPETLGVHSSGRDDLSVGGSSGSRNNGDFDEDNSDSDTGSNVPSNGRSRGNGNGRGRPRPGKNDPSGTKPLPGKPGISRLTNDSVMVRWNLQPGADETQIEFFKIQYKEYRQPNQTGRDMDKPNKEVEKDASFWKTADDEIAPHLLSHTITGLDPNSTYRFRVAIVYKNGDNAHGPSSSKFPLSQDTHVKRPKTVPLITSLVPLSPSALEVKWIYNHPLSASTPIDGFIVYYRETTTAGDYYSVDVPGTMARSHVLSHLLPGTAYEVKIQARNSAGTSDYSNIITNSTLQKVESLPPTLVTTSTETPPKILTPPHDAFVVYLLLGISAFIIILVTVVFFTLCVVKQKQPTGESTSSSSSSGSTSSSHRLRHPSNTRSIDRNSLRGSPIHSSYSLRRDKLKYGKERHPKAHSLHNLHHSMSKLDYGNSYNNYIKTATINKNAINGTLTKSMNGLAFRSETTTHSGFVYQGTHDSSDTELSDKMSEIRITVNPQYEPESVRVDMSDRRNGLLTTATTTTTTAVSRGRNSPRVHLKNSTFRSLNRNASFKSHQSLHHVTHHHQHTHQYQLHHTLNHGSSGTHRPTGTDQYSHGHSGMNGIASNVEGISPRSDFSKKSAKSGTLTLDRNNRNSGQSNHNSQLACETGPNVLNSNNNNNNNNRSQYLSSYAESPLSSSGPGSSASSTSANVTSGGSSSNGASSDNCGDGDGTTLLLSRCSTTHNTTSANGPLVIMQSSC